jgi:hypothetical protein
MDKIVPFEKFQSKNISQKEGKEQGGKKIILWGCLSDETKQMIIDLQREVVRSKEAGRFVISEAELEKERTEINKWTDEEIVAFVSNPDNEIELGQKPYLLTALHGRIIGR